MQATGLLLIESQLRCIINIFSIKWKIIATFIEMLLIGLNFSCDCVVVWNSHWIQSIYIRKGKSNIFYEPCFVRKKIKMLKDWEIHTKVPELTQTTFPFFLVLTKLSAADATKE